MSRQHKLRRDISLAGAVTLGLGSIVGTGVFVSLGVAAGVAGPNVLWAILIAALVAICNGLSSAQLAAAHPVSGGTYEYGYHWLSPGLGFTAGWLFVCAKSASAATAALGLAGYLRHAFGVFQSVVGVEAYLAQVGIAILSLFVMSGLVLVGIKRTTMINSVIVSLTVGSLLVLVWLGLRPAMDAAGSNLSGLWLFSQRESNEASTPHTFTSMLSAAALMFVAFTGYGRIATMGEEVKNPKWTIPRAMILTLAISMTLYLSVGFVAVAAIGPGPLGASAGRWASPLLEVAGQIDQVWVSKLLAWGAITAMAGVLLNLLLGLSRVVLAMSRRSDLPVFLSSINSGGVPVKATLLVVLIIGSLICVGDVRLSWSFSALTVLIYYALTNLCAIRVSPNERIFPAWISWVGLVSCLSLAFFIQWEMLVAGALAVGIGFLWRAQRSV